MLALIAIVAINSKENTLSKETAFFTCCATENNKRCISTKNLIRLQSKNGDSYWCHFHYEKFKKRDSLESEASGRTEVFRQAIKDSGLHPSKFFREHFGFDLKDAAKNLTATK
jgi:hypothetical protein